MVLMLLGRGMDFQRLEFHADKSVRRKALVFGSCVGHACALTYEEQCEADYMTTKERGGDVPLKKESRIWSLVEQSSSIFSYSE